MQDSGKSNAAPTAGLGDEALPESANAVDHPTLADPWHRFWARAFDIYLLSFVASFVVGLPIALIQPSWLEHEMFTTFTGEAILSLMFLPMALFLEAIIYACFGTTPGKALAGIKLLTVQGERLTFRQVIRRNLRIYTSGLGLGLPIIMLYFLWQRYNELSSWQYPKYDTALETRVWIHGSDWRTLLVAIVTIAFYVVFNMQN